MSTTLLPFLYQTRTIQRLSKTAISTPALRAFFHGASTSRGDKKPSGGNAIPFEFPPGSEHLDPDFTLETIPPNHRPTITPSERSAFNKIFEEIAARGVRPPTLSPASIKATIQPPTVSPRSPAAVHADTARDTIGVIMKDAAAAQSGEWRPAVQPFSEKHLMGQVAAAADPMQALMRFPPSLRKAASAAFGALQKERPGPAAAVPLSVSIDEEKQRAVERARVEQKMKDTKTDFELWEVLEDEVFSMVGKLDLPGVPKKKKKKGAVPAPAESEQGASISIHGTLYPQYLLTAIRLMDTKFARTSPLALNILPRIKALGLSSYVLGVSTSFYNALAGIHWNRYGDAEAAFNVLEEMRHAGLFADSETESLMDRILHVFDKAEDGSTGPFLSELLNLPEYEFSIRPRIHHWKRAVSAQALEQRREMSG